MRGKKVVSVLLLLALFITGFGLPNDRFVPLKLPSAMSDNMMYDKDDDQDQDVPTESEESEEDENSEDEPQKDNDGESKDDGSKNDETDDESGDETDDESDDEDEWDDEEDDEDIPLTKMTDYSGIVSNNAVLVYGNRYEISANFIPQKYMVSDKRVVKVTRYGEVRPKKEGSAMIVAVGDEGESVSYFIKVEKPKMRQRTVLNGSVSDIMDMVDDYYEAYPSEIIIDDPGIASVDPNTGELFALKRGRTKVTLMFGVRKLKKVLKVK